MAQSELISVEHLTRNYGDTRAVHDISFGVGRGEVVGFLGPNGAGKTTTMQIISGNLAPSAGQVRINGLDILDAPKRAKAELGYLPEQPPVYRELTVDEYLHYCARINRIPRIRVRKAVDTAKERCGLGDVGGRLIGNLSKGYRQRTGIAQAIIHSPAVIILDEPTVGLDPIQIREIRGLIRELGDTHSVILSTHILPEVQATCDRVLIINHGEIALTDDIESLGQRMRPVSLRVALEHAPGDRELAMLEEIEEVETLGGGRYRLFFTPGEETARRIAQRLDTRSRERDWGIYEIVPEQVTLEQVFIDITCREEPELSGGVSVTTS